jgi:hypothetical protein
MKCLLGRQLADLPAEARSSVEDQLARNATNGGLADIVLSVLLRDAGIRTGKTTLNLHRRELCECRRRTDG